MFVWHPALDRIYVQDIPVLQRLVVPVAEEAARSALHSANTADPWHQAILYCYVCMTFGCGCRAFGFIARLDSVSDCIGSMHFDGLSPRARVFPQQRLVSCQPFE